MHLLPGNLKSAVMLCFPYYVGEYCERNISRYALINDYHEVAGKILSGITEALRQEFPGEEFIAFADNSPLCEVKAAVKSGLGKLGRNGQVISEDWGSYVFLGAVMTSLPLSCSVHYSECENCGRCISACPTGALTAGGFAKEKCRSFITQKKGILTPGEENEIKNGGLVWGCDICLDVCPHNKNARKTYLNEFYKNIEPIINLENVDMLFKLKPYNFRKPAVIKRNIEIVTGAHK